MVGRGRWRCQAARALICLVVGIWRASAESAGIPCEGDCWQQRDCCVEGRSGLVTGRWYEALAIASCDCKSSSHLTAAWTEVEPDVCVGCAIGQNGRVSPSQRNDRALPVSFLQVLSEGLKKTMGRRAGCSFSEWPPRRTSASVRAAADAQARCHPARWAQTETRLE